MPFHREPVRTREQPGREAASENELVTKCRGSIVFAVCSRAYPVNRLFSERVNRLAKISASKACTVCLTPKRRSRFFICPSFSPVRSIGYPRTEAFCSEYSSQREISRLFRGEDLLQRLAIVDP